MAKGKLIPRETADPIIDRVYKGLRNVMLDFDVCGSYRRGCRMIRDVDIVAIAVQVSDREAILAAFGELLDPEAPRFHAHGKMVHSGPVNGVQVDLNVGLPDEKATMVCYATGSMMFNIKMRGLAKRQGFKLSQYGLFKPDGLKVVTPTEEDVFKAIGMDFKIPEERDLH